MRSLINQGTFSKFKYAGVTERLLQFIWQLRYFNKNGLVTTKGETLEIIFPGIYNSNQGPDFSEARIKIANTTWAGNVELHLKTSDWDKHGHQDDKNYNTVVLHVVWEDDTNNHQITGNENDKPLPVLELKDKVSKLLLTRYEDLMNSSTFIPCQQTAHSVPGIIWKAWKERLMAERLIRKSNTIENYLLQNNFHWEETCWWLLARNFGMNVNADAFEQIARSISMTILAKHKHQVIQLEALLFGQAGLLKEKFTEAYPKMLQKEYKFLSRKYNLTPVPCRIFFLRMRPGNFPTIRLAQLAMMVNQSAHLFSKIKEASTVDVIKKWFDVTANDYWHYHYLFDENSSFKKKSLGATMIDNLIINTITPILFAYGHHMHEQKYKDKALTWLECISAENNSITRGFEKLEIENKNARDSQALIQLKNEYCDNRRCLDCFIGNAILKS